LLIKNNPPFFPKASNNDTIFKKFDVQIFAIMKETYIVCRRHVALG